MSQMQPSYRLIAAAAAKRTVCEGPVEPIGVLLIILTPVGTSVAGLLSREYGRSGWPFYALWFGVIVLAISLFATALAFES